MPTAKTYSYALLGEKGESARAKGTQLLRHSHKIIATEPVQVGCDHQLLMDRHVVDWLVGCCRTVHQPRKHEDNPIITAECPWEGSGVVAGNGIVLRDPNTNRLRLYGPCHDLAMREKVGKTNETVRVLMYESDDGIRWERPKLNLFDYEGNKANNIVLDPHEGLQSTVFVLPLPARMRHRGQYAMWYHHGIPEEKLADPQRMHTMSYHLAFSEDGIHWTDAPENPILRGRADGQNCIVYNADRDVFMMYRRATPNAGEIRRIAYLESNNLLSWTQPQCAIDHDELDPTFHYAMPVTRYHGVYLGFLWCLHQAVHPERNVLGDGKDFITDTQLAWSRDGITWQRHPRRPAFLEESPPHKDVCDWAGAAAATNVIEMDDQLLVYYTGSEQLHRPGVQNPTNKASHNVCLGRLRKDGFVSIDAGEDGGFMLTKPLKYPGGQLHINARTNDSGFIRVSIREGHGVRDGEWPEAWHFDQVVPFTGDSLDETIQWRHGKTLETFPSQTLRLHFWMEQAELFSFWFE